MNKKGSAKALSRRSFPYQERKLPLNILCVKIPLIFLLLPKPKSINQVIT